MNPDLKVWLDIIYRWTHVVAGIAWIGHLYFFNFVNAQVAKTYDADSKKKVVPELMPRALYWFRWGAAWTWLTGILLLAWVYYMGTGMLVSDTSTLSVGAGASLSLLILVVAFFLYDTLWKVLATKEQVGVVVSFVLLALLTIGMAQVFTPRATFIHVGAILGTIMAANVWMRIWPSQRKIIAAIAGGTAPDPAVVALAGLRSKQNTYMSVPLVFLMVSNHFAFFYWWIALLFVLAGWGVTKLLFLKSAGPAPKQY